MASVRPILMVSVSLVVVVVGVVLVICVVIDWPFLTTIQVG